MWLYVSLLYVDILLKQHLNGTYLYLCTTCYDCIVKFNTNTTTATTTTTITTTTTTTSTIITTTTTTIINATVSTINTYNENKIIILMSRFISVSSILEIQNFSQLRLYNNNYFYSLIF